MVDERVAMARALALVVSGELGCGRVASGSSDEDDNDSTGDDGDDNDNTDDGDEDVPVELDMSDSDDECDFPDCSPMIDVLFVIDNSGSMAEEQRILSASLPALLDRLQGLYDGDGDPFQVDVDIMFTTTDVGHPECMSSPDRGAPQGQACVERIDEFAGLPEACTDGCSVAVEPVHPFIHFEGPMAETTNVPGGDVEAALRCLAPQGLDGCGYEAPLEAMLLAIDPEATWNQGSRPFLREEAMLAVVFITDEEDCSVRAPEGYAYFVDPMQDQYWEINPDTGSKTHATSAVCWNAGVDCGAPDANGIYADCQAIDTGVLHGVEKYLSYLRDELIVGENKEVVMLGILGVPEVTAYNPEPPYQPIAGGVGDLVYRDWKDGPWPDGDIIEPGEDAASKQFELGIGPGCTGEDGMGGFIGQPIPPVRIREVCEGLDEDQKLRCCIDSICDNDYSDAFTCLGGMIQKIIVPAHVLPPHG